jgi:hypothetical protein
MLAAYLVVALFLVLAIVIRGWGSAAWTFLGLGVLIAVLQIGSWFRDWWAVNLLRNRVDAKRRLRRQDRDAS